MYYLEDSGKICALNEDGINIVILKGETSANVIKNCKRFVISKGKLNMNPTNTSTIMNDVLENYEIIPDGFGVKLIKKSDHIAKMAEEDTYVTIFYTIKDNYIWAVADGIENIESHYGGIELDYFIKNYGYLVVKRSDYNLSRDNAKLDIYHNYKLIEENGQRKLVKLLSSDDDNLNLTPVPTTTSSAVTIN